MWHADQQCLYWCDITEGRLHRHDPVSGETESVIDGNGEPSRMIGGFTIEADGAILLFMTGGRIERWNGAKSEIILAQHPEMRMTRFNDVIADPAGRVFCGTMSTEHAKGELYRFNLDRTLTAVVDDVLCSNGLAFTRDRKRLYYTDSFAQSISLFDYDDGDIRLRRPFVNTKDEDGFPDGMTVDAEDYVWSAHWGAGFIVRYAPSGEEVQRLAIPVPNVSSLTFGGKNLQTLFITTAGGDARDTNGELAGNIFAIEPGVCGVAEFRSRICSPQI